MDKIFRVVYKHWKDVDRELEIHGDMPEDINNDASDFVFVKRHDGLIMDIRKESLVSIEQVKPVL